MWCPQLSEARKADRGPGEDDELLPCQSGASFSCRQPGSWGSRGGRLRAPTRSTQFHWKKDNSKAMARKLAKEAARSDK